MRLTSNSFDDGGKIDPRLALARPATPGPVEFSRNANPELSWHDVPEGTASFAVTCIDIDCPSLPDDVNQTDREVPPDLPRVDFTHWLLADLPPEMRTLPEASHSEGVTERGKHASASPLGIHGVNDYTMWFTGDAALEGTWCGYDGPAPPWNDSIPHRYQFTVYALDVPSLGLDPGFSRDDFEQASEGHVLASDTITGTYASNPRLH